jgi:hypothetical protein
VRAETDQQAVNVQRSRNRRARTEPVLHSGAGTAQTAERRASVQWRWRAGTFTAVGRAFNRCGLNIESTKETMTLRVGSNWNGDMPYGWFRF